MIRKKSKVNEDWYQPVIEFINRYPQTDKKGNINYLITNGLAVELALQGVIEGQRIKTEKVRNPVEHGDIDILVINEKIKIPTSIPDFPYFIDRHLYKGLHVTIPKDQEREYSSIVKYEGNDHLIPCLEFLLLNLTAYKNPLSYNKDNYYHDWKKGRKYVKDLLKKYTPDSKFLLGAYIDAGILNGFRSHSTYDMLYVNPATDVYYTLLKSLWNEFPYGEANFEHLVKTHLLKRRKIDINVHNLLKEGKYEIINEGIDIMDKIDRILFLPNEKRKMVITTLMERLIKNKMDTLSPWYFYHSLKYDAEPRINDKIIKNLLKLSDMDILRYNISNKPDYKNSFDISSEILKIIKTKK